MKARMRRLSASIDSATLVDHHHNSSHHQRECHTSEAKISSSGGDSIITESRIDRVKKLLSSPLSRRKSSGGHSHVGIGFASFGSFSTSTTSCSFTTSSTSSGSKSTGDGFKTFGTPLSILINADSPPATLTIKSNIKSPSSTPGDESISNNNNKTERRISTAGSHPVPVKEPGLPFVLTRLCNFIENNSGLCQEGIFRISGNVKLVDKLKHQFDESGDALLEDVGDVASAAALLKLFLRELPDPVIPHHLHQPFFDAARDYAIHERDGIERMRALVAVLPVENFFLLKYLCSFLYRVSQNEARNRMNSSSLGIVFGPNIFRLSAEDYKDFKEQAISAPNQIVSIFIADHEVIFDTEVISRLRQDSLSSLLTTTLSQDSKPSTPPKTKSGSLLGLNRYRKSSGPPTLLNSSQHIIPILILNNEALSPSIRAKAFPRIATNNSRRPSFSFGRKRRESKLLGADILLTCRSASEERSTDRDSSLEEFVDMRRCNSTEEVSTSINSQLTTSLSSGGIRENTLFPSPASLSSISTNSTVSCSSPGGNRLFSPSRVTSEAIPEISVCPTIDAKKKRSELSPENSIDIYSHELQSTGVRDSVTTEREPVVKHHPTSSISQLETKVTKQTSQDKKDEIQDEERGVTKQDTLAAEEPFSLTKNKGGHQRRRLSAIAIGKMAQFQSDRWKCVDEDDIPPDVEMNNNDLISRTGNLEEDQQPKLKEEKEKENDNNGDNDLNDDEVLLCKSNRGGTILVRMEAVEAVNQGDKTLDARKDDKKPNEHKDTETVSTTVFPVELDDGSSTKELSPSDESSDPMSSLPLPVISTEHRNSWPREGPKCDSVVVVVEGECDTTDRSRDDGNNTYSNLFASFPLVPQRSSLLDELCSPHSRRRCSSSLNIEHEAPVSPSAFRNYLTSRGKRLSDPAVVPSPPLEQRDFSSCSLKDRFLSAKEVKKRMHLLKKTLKEWENEFERRTGRKASNEDKSSSNSIRPLLLEMIRLRRGLKESLLSGGKESDDTEDDRDEGFFGRTKKRHKHVSNKTFFLPLDNSSDTNSSCLKPSSNGLSMKQLQDCLKDIEEELETKRVLVERCQDLQSMTREQISAEKLDLQKALLRFESLYGRPGSKLERDVMRPVYDRYRTVKRLASRMTRSNSLSKDAASSGSMDLQPILEHVVMSYVPPSSSSGPSSLVNSTTVDNNNSVFSSTDSNPETVIAKEPLTSEADKDSEKNLHELPLMELLDHLKQSQVEKKHLRKLIKSFEEDFTRRQGRKVEKDDRIHFEPVYTNYKHIKGRLRLLEALVSKTEKEQYKL